MTEAIERAARALHKHRQECGFSGEAAWEYEPSNIRELYLGSAQAVLASLQVDEGMVEAFNKLAAWDAALATHRKRGLEDRFNDLAASVYSDWDEVKVPVRFGDIRATVCVIAAARAAIEAAIRYAGGRG